MRDEKPEWAAQNRLLVGEHLFRNTSELVGSSYNSLMSSEDWYSSPFWKGRKSIKGGEEETNTLKGWYSWGRHQSRQSELPGGRGQEGSVLRHDGKGTDSSRLHSQAALSALPGNPPRDTEQLS